MQEARLSIKAIHDSLLKRQAERLKSQGQSADEDKDKGGGTEAVTGGAVVGEGEEEKKQDGDEEGAMDESEVALGGANYHWQDKFRPRKPRYINRVRTGWDWNKYNSTHYDKDNPPPKTVQGYKFTVFYPDLIDKTKTPKYFLERADSPEFAILRFHAPGGPYEDVAFKIINKEWDTNRKAGFRVMFDKGVLQLHINFKRIWYRR
jgi:hypothetical protein